MDAGRRQVSRLRQQLFPRPRFLARPSAPALGIVVAVAKRGGLLFTPITDSKAMDRLRSGVAYLYSSRGTMRVSSPAMTMCFKTTATVLTPQKVPRAASQPGGFFPMRLPNDQYLR
jgi:hypothetical protein